MVLLLGRGRVFTYRTPAQYRDTSPTVYRTLGRILYRTTLQPIKAFNTTGVYPHIRVERLSFHQSFVSKNLSYTSRAQSPSGVWLVSCIYGLGIVYGRVSVYGSGFLYRKRTRIPPWPSEAVSFQAIHIGRVSSPICERHNSVMQLNNTRK